MAPARWRGAAKHAGSATGHRSPSSRRLIHPRGPRLGGPGLDDDERPESGLVVIDVARRPGLRRSSIGMRPDARRAVRPGSVVAGAMRGYHARENTVPLVLYESIDHEVAAPRAFVGAARRHATRAGTGARRLRSAGRRVAVDPLVPGRIIPSAARRRRETDRRSGKPGGPCEATHVRRHPGRTAA
jgi:hypothetical protein